MVPPTRFKIAVLKKMAPPTRFEIVVLTPKLDVGITSLREVFAEEIIQK